MHKYHRFLIDYDMSMLRALARNRGATLTTNRHAEAVNDLAALLLDPVSVRTALTQLSAEAREALEALQLAGGRIRAPRFTRRFGQVRPVGPGRLEREAFWQEPTNPAEELWYAALIFRAFDQDEGGPGEFIFIPSDLLALLPEPPAAPAAFSVETVPPPNGRTDDEMTLVRDIFAYLVYVQNHNVRPYADGRLGRRDMAALQRRMDGSDERRFTLLQHLAHRLGFLDRQGEFLRLDAGPVKRWLTAAPAQQLAILQESWRDDRAWNDLCRVPGLVCDQETPWSNDPVATRRALLTLLARCPLEEWWSVASFLTTVKETHPDFQRPDGDYTSWYIRDVASGEYLSGFESWDRVEGALIADLLAGPLYWLGVVETLAEESACRLTSAGARFLELIADSAVEPPSPPILVHADFSVEVPPPASLYTRFQLERFADALGSQASAPRSQEGPTTLRYQLGAGSLARALYRGIEVEQVLAFLQQASERPLPANVAGQLRLWAGRFGQVDLEEVVLLQVKNERTLRELSVLPETRHLLAKVLSPTSALVRKRDFARLHKELRDLGYLLPGDLSGDSAEHG